MLNKLKSNLIDKVGDRYSIKEAKKYNPRLKVNNLEKGSFNSTDFTKNLVVQNKLLCTPEDIKIVTKQTWKYSDSVVIEVLPSVRAQILRTGYLYVGWRRCAVSEHFSVTRCYKCSRYNHIKQDCKAEIVCPICAGNHEFKDCRAQFKKCNNCISYNNSHKTNVPVDHTVRDNDCHVYKLVLANIMSKTNLDG